MDNDAPAPLILTGSCLCGAVTYAALDAFTYAQNCHCALCRRATGAAFKPFAGIELKHLTVTKGAEAIFRFGSPDSHDAHCRTCTSLLFSVVRGGQWVHVALGTLIDTPSIRPSAHIFVGSKAAWHVITDDLPQFDRFGD
jgi:hypothetical protein